MVALTIAAILAPIPLWQVHADPAMYATVPVHGTAPVENAAGYRFTVTPKLDGSLPLVRGDLGNAMASGSPPLVLYKKLPNETYALYCSWANIDSDGDGLLLEPGEYLYASSATGAQFQGCAILGGEWFTPAAQSTYLAVTGGDTSYTTVGFSGGGTSKGIRYLVKTRTDSKFPLVTQSVNNQLGHVHASSIVIFRRESRLIYSFAANWNPAEAPATQGLLLGPGEYVVEVKSTTRPAAYFQFARLCTGRFVARP